MYDSIHIYAILQSVYIDCFANLILSDLINCDFNLVSVRS